MMVNRLITGIFLFICAYFGFNSKAAIKDIPNKKSYTISYLGTEKGLPSDAISCVIQDSKGYMWIGTPQGLVKFDGYTLQLYSTGNHRKNGLLSNNIIDITEDQYNNLWLATDKGVALFDVSKELFHFFDMEDRFLPLLSMRANCLACDKKGNIWIGWAGNGIDVIHPKEGHLKHFESIQPNSKFTSDWITRIFPDSQNNIWIGSWDGGLNIVSSDLSKVEHISTLPYKQGTFNLLTPFVFLEDNNSNIWIGSWEQNLIQLQKESDHYSVNQIVSRGDSVNNGLSGDIIFDLTLDLTNNLWVATNYGVDFFNLNDSSYQIHNHSEISTGNEFDIFNSTQSLFCDKEGLIWAGTMGKGVEIIDGIRKQFETYNLPQTNGFNSQAIQSFTNLDEDHLLIGCLSRGFGIYNLNTKAYTPYKDSELFSFINEDINTVKYFEWDKNGYLWLGTRYNGLIKVDIKNKRYLELSNLTGEMGFVSREVNDIYTDRRGFIWVATEQGLYKIVEFSDDFRGFNALHYFNDPADSTSLSSNLISSIYEDAKNNIWVSTFDKGVNKLVSPPTVHYPLVFEHYLYNPGGKNHIQSENINSIFEDSQQNLWFATSGKGLLLWNDSLHTFDNVLDNNQVIYNLIEDDSENIWLSSNKGITKFFYNDSIKNVEHYQKENGLQGYNFIKGSAYKDRFGNIYFGGYNGFNAFNPNNIHSNKYIPPIRISSVRVNNEIVKPVSYQDTTLVIKYNQSSFSVEFASLAYSNPSNNKYAYKLANIDTKWRYVDANMRTATYANLRPGNYTLLIKGSNGMGLWNSNPTELSIFVETPPYLRWWAFLVYIFLFFTVTGIVVYISLQRQNFKRALEIEHIERNKSDKLNQFKQQLFTNISHEFLTPITILSSLLEHEIKQSPKNHKLQLMQRNVARLSQMVKQFLNFRKSETNTLSLKISKHKIVAFTQILCENFIELAKTKNVKFTYQLPDIEYEAWFDDEKIDSILHNLLSNAIKFTPGNGNVNLQLGIKNSIATFTVKDSGKGISKEHIPHIFERFYSVKSNKSSFSGFGIGLSLTKANVELHKGSIQVKSELNKGAQFKVKIPIDEKYYNETDIVTKHPNIVQKEIINPISTAKSTAILNQLEQQRATDYHLLLVEDNDDFRGVLKEQLQAYFKVSEAANGEEAIKKVKSKAIDIIVSDVLMPKMDGYELCRQIKENDTTSHIPIILVTAKISEEDRSRGYEAGADSFITKPFSFETLITRVQTLLQQRIQLIEKYTSNKEIRPDKVQISDSDEKFLKEFRHILEANISNPDFNVKTICSELGMSNSKLYRTTRQLLGSSPLEAIKQYRLTRAEQLLQTKEFSISEVAHKCGFSDLSYFGVCFKKQFGVSASQYIND
nr:two-component regulator propeller domain-containing protein [uncultured Carboxylicivirga sp.]